MSLDDLFGGGASSKGRMGSKKEREEKVAKAAETLEGAPGGRFGKQTPARQPSTADDPFATSARERLGKPVEVGHSALDDIGARHVKGPPAKASSTDKALKGASDWGRFKGRKS